MEVNKIPIQWKQVSIGELQNGMHFKLTLTGETFVIIEQKFVSTVYASPDNLTQAKSCSNTKTVFTLFTNF